MPLRAENIKKSVIVAIARNESSGYQDTVPSLSIIISEQNDPFFQVYDPIST